jgi:hypothetical protein
MPTGIDQEHPDLAVLNAAGGAAVLAGDSGRMATLFQKPGFVDYQHRLWGSQMLHDIVAQCIAHRIGVPQGTAQQVLKTIRCAITAHVGQLPAVLALGRAEQAAQIRHGALPRFGALKIGRQAALDIGQVSQPSLDEAGGLIGRRKGCTPVD